MEQVQLGHMCVLEVIDISDQGCFVDAKEHGSLFVPRSQIPQDLQIGDNLRVFLYVDGHRVLATAKHPYLECGMTGRLTVTSIECGTVYMDLGIPKELVVPVSEQRGSFEVGRSSLIHVAIDEQGRLFGTQRLNKYIEDKAPLGIYKKNQKVRVVPVSRTPLGFRVVVDDKYYGLIYKDNQKGPLYVGKRYDGFILNARDDGRLDITLQEMGLDGIQNAAKIILQALYLSNGQLSFNDRSSPEIIEDFLHMSKAKFKKAIGHLYKHQLIVIKTDGIEITQKGQEEYLQHQKTKKSEAN